MSTDATRTVQPLPTHVRLAMLKVYGEPITAIVRTWRPEDIPDCRLCDSCCADRGECLHIVRGKFTPLEAATLSLRGVPCQGRAASAPVAPPEASSPPEEPEESAVDFFRRVMGSPAPTLEGGAP